MKDFLSQMEQDLKLGNYAVKTRKTYVRFAKRFVKHFQKPIAKLGLLRRGMRKG